MTIKVYRYLDIYSYQGLESIKTDLRHIHIVHHFTVLIPLSVLFTVLSIECHYKLWTCSTYLKEFCKTASRVSFSFCSTNLLINSHIDKRKVKQTEIYYMGSGSL